MSLFEKKSYITITCHKRIVTYLAAEVLELGFVIEEQFLTGVVVKGTLNDCIRLNLNLRCASQVLFSLDEFEAHHPDDVYNNLVDIAWEQIMPKGSYFSVTSNVFHDSVNNSMFVNLRVKDAIVDCLREIHGDRPSTGSELIGIVVHLHWKNDHAEVFIDTSGDSLARHGYRKIPGRAPMLEGLAAATIFASEWDRKSPFINPMCGSGTLAIEAALIATNTRPGLFRTNYPFMHLINYNEEVYLDELGKLEAQIIDVPELKIIASDYSDFAISNAEKNAKAAGVSDIISFEICDFAETTIPEGNGNAVMMMNPEYGLRLGELEELEETYARIGDFMKNDLQGYFGYIFTGNLELAKKIGLKAKRRIEFYNSTLDCRLLEFEIYKGSKNQA